MQAIHVYEPFRSASLANGKTRELFGSVYASLNEPSGIGASAISRQFLRDQSVAARNYLSAWDKAITFIREHPTDAREILAHKLGLPIDIASAATWVDATTTDETSYDILKRTIDSAKSAGIIPQDFFLEKDMVIKQ